MNAIAEPTGFLVRLAAPGNATLALKSAEDGLTVHVDGKDRSLFSAHVRRFHLNPEGAMRGLIAAIVTALPRSAVRHAGKDGIRVAFPNGATLQCWPDCVVVDAPGDAHAAWFLPEWAGSEEDAERVMREVFESLAAALAESGA